MRVVEIFPDIDIPIGEVDFFNNNASHMQMTAGDYFVTNDTWCGKIAFIDSGLLQSVITDGGKKYVIANHFKNQFVSVFTSFFYHKNSLWTIQALEPTQLTLISEQLLFLLCQRHICWLQFWLRVLGNKTTHLIEKEKQLLSSKRSY